LIPLEYCDGGACKWCGIIKCACEWCGFIIQLVDDGGPVGGICIEGS
jgi:hypothetical protein